MEVSVIVWALVVYEGQRANNKDAAYTLHSHCENVK